MTDDLFDDGPIEHTQHIIVEFIGGYWDGMVLDSNSTDPVEQKLITDYYYFFSNKGTVGKGFYGFSPIAVEFFMKHGRQAINTKVDGTHCYRVESRWEENNEVLVRYKYEVRQKGKKADEPKSEQPS